VTFLLGSKYELALVPYDRKDKFKLPEQSENKLMSKIVTILGFAGSLRKNSYNKALLRAALELAPKDAKLEIFDLEGIPPFNQDLENQPTEKVREFKAKIRAADAILIATPEYNYSIPGVLKNVIDWASRPYGDNAFEGKPVAIMGASIGMMGTARAQYHLRQTFVFLNMYPLNHPEVMVPFASEKIDEKGRVTDEKTREKIRELIESLVAWTRKLKK
jgi:chromate reductase